MSGEAKDKTAVQWDNLRCLYAEDLHNKRVAVTVGGVRDTPKGARLFCQSGESEAWDVAFSIHDSEGKTPYIQIPKPNGFGKRTTLLRQFVMATGGDPSANSVGHKVTLYPVESKKSQTGQAIRIAVPEQMA